MSNDLLVMAPAAKIGDFLGCAWALGPDAASKAALLWRQTKNVRVRFGLARYRPEDRFSIRTRFGELHFRDNFGDITNLTDLLHGRAYETDREPGPGVILDVGANIGMAAVWFRNRLPGRRIHCFEPLIENVRMIGLNCPEATVNNVAVGARAGAVVLPVDRDAVMASMIPWDRAVDRREAEVVALDDYVRSHDIDRIAILKVDVEGMELDVLQGAAETLRRTEQVVLETHARERHAAVIDLLTNAGFSLDREEFSDRTGLVFGSRPPADGSAARKST